eukprot:446836_1
MSRKRKLEAIHRHDDEDSNCNISLAKRRKLNSITIATSNIKDSNQCASIYETINDSSLIKQLQIPEVILKQISEYTTVKCDNFSKCHNELSALNQHKLYKEQTNGYCNNNDDIEIESRDYFYNKPYDDKDLNKDIQIFCNDCSKQLKQCDMNAENWYESWNGFKYQYDYDEEEYCSKRFMDYETCQCNNTFRTCDNHRIYVGILVIGVSITKIQNVKIVKKKSVHQDQVYYIVIIVVNMFVAIVLKKFVIVNMILNGADLLIFHVLFTKNVM